mmetsp:Transcript_105847/g.326552  ORF Transcript_105847/g.326552 Transcript_105847/m.326552 type:complete len:126 (-) Transcript_105847:9-386(-)
MIVCGVSDGMRPPRAPAGAEATELLDTLRGVFRGEDRVFGDGRSDDGDRGVWSDPASDSGVVCLVASGLPASAGPASASDATESDLGFPLAGGSAAGGSAAAAAACPIVRVAPAPPHEAEAEAFP